MSRSKVLRQKPRRCPYCKARKPEEVRYVLMRGTKCIGSASEPFGGLPPCHGSFHRTPGSWASR